MNWIGFRPRRCSPELTYPLLNGSGGRRYAVLRTRRGLSGLGPPWCASLRHPRTRHGMVRSGFYLRLGAVFDTWFRNASQWLDGQWAAMGAISCGNLRLVGLW